ncbi:MULTISPECIES: SDR family oxidoreductase [Streptomyces]|uniref:NADP-dependent 3-hydroxy acid dehydrogenase YdfG n=1 Tax=Streptomyces melanosporofaciens TaxID=67327 RepID=A0A1H5A0P1_STRMJ|nr:SDR family NAD(P)-dependent oxidoreductase [Streptomyces melanosporofaciens]SED35291.1 NADP-dependent 3-hydroxy acid dehydrogenase YdfG [Streptomyces melanosporofaciens]
MNSHPSGGPGDMSGRTAVVSGASSGIGLAIVRRFLEAGATVHGLARRGHLVEEQARDAAPEADRLHHHGVDVGDSEAVRDWARGMPGPVDTLVCAAGTNIPERRLAQLTPRAWDSMLATNLSGTFYLLHALLPRLREAHGDVVILSSVAGAWPDHTGPAYQAAKAGLLGLARGAGRDEYGNGIRVCTILPGIVNTPILDDRPEPPPRELRDLFVQPPDIAEACLAAITLPRRACVAEMTIVATALQSMGNTQTATPTPPRAGPGEHRPAVRPGTASGTS